MSDLAALQTSPYLAKCKRLRTDGPTPCLCCPGECVGNWPGHTYDEALANADESARLMDEAEDRMYAAGAAAKRNREQSLAIGCALPFVLIIVFVILAAAGGGGH